MADPNKTTNGAQRWLPTIVGVLSFLVITGAALSGVIGQFARMDERVIAMSAQAQRNKEHINAIEDELKYSATKFAEILVRLDYISDKLDSHDAE